jgi:ribosomal protein S14
MKRTLLVKGNQPMTKQDLFKQDDFRQQYALAKEQGDKRFGSPCEHTHTSNGVCRNCLRKVAVRGAQKQRMDADAVETVIAHLQNLSLAVTPETIATTLKTHGARGINAAAIENVLILQAWDALQAVPAYVEREVQV